MAPGLMELGAPDMENRLMLERLGLMTHCCAPTRDTLGQISVKSEEYTQERLMGFQIKRKMSRQPKLLFFAKFHVCCYET